MIPSRVVVAVILILVGIFVLVVGVGLLRNQIDTNDLALLLAPIISGLILGASVKHGGGGGDKK